MSYKVEYTNRAKETLRRIPHQDTIRILKKIEWIAQHADQLQHSRIQNPPSDLEKICRYRVGIYRVLYWIEHGLKESALKAISSATSCLTEIENYLSKRGVKL